MKLMSASGSQQVMSRHLVCVACLVAPVVLAGDSTEGRHGLPMSFPGCFMLQLSLPGAG